MSWTGIGNENEFYSEHYLAEVFNGDIKNRLEAWLDAEKSAKADGTTGQAADEQRTPYNQLGSLTREYTRVERELNRTRSVESRLEQQRTWLQKLCAVFDLPWSPEARELSDDLIVPLLSELNDSTGAPLLWVLEAVPDEDINTDPLSLFPVQAQLSDNTGIPMPKAMEQKNWQTLLSQAIYTHGSAPRWILLVSFNQWLLLDRAKFAQSRLLRFDWSEILGRRDSNTLKATSILLHRESLLADQGQCLLDTLDENAHKHAYGVSEDLKYALRESIELLGNEAAKQLVERARERKEGVFSGDNALDEQELSNECLRYMYRLLFLFYIEARPELGYAPINDPVYLHGYSLESLRELELVPLNSPREQIGRYINDTLATLFRLIDEGFTRPKQQTLDSIDAQKAAFELPALKSHLFDPERTTLLNNVVFPNHLLQHIIKLMSLTKKGSGRKRRGRISYAQLGINQLGAVYEALLSFRGFFAKEDLYEVKKKGEDANPLETGYFVNATALEQYNDDEKVYDWDENKNQKLRVYPKGTFIYRMAGRDRQKSASYYTPEVLTQCLVKYALKELFKQQLDPLPNDEVKAKQVLQMTVCEPAMGSAAFLNEAVNQLSDKYLELMQSARQERIPQSEYAIEKQKVKMYLADHNVFGVDLNPVAVELAEVSLWLNALSADRFVPWFGLQLHCGNSLIGARREIYAVGSLTSNSSKDNESWLNKAPEKLAMDEPLPEDHVWHFLLPDKGMSKYADKVFKERYKTEIKAISVWNKEFTAKFDKDEIKRLLVLSKRVDELWAEHASQLAALRKKTTDPYQVYGFEGDGSESSLAFKDSALDGELLANELSNTSAYIRLKLVMDYWCTLWFWPIDEYETLPSREEYFFDLENLLLGDSVSSAGPANEISDLFATTQDVEEGKRFVDNFGVVNLKVLFKASPRFEISKKMAGTQKFFHWHLEFADLFRGRGGFDLVLGNPPWIKVEWEEGGVLGDVEPLFAIRNFSATKAQYVREQTFEEYGGLEDIWRKEFVESEGAQNYFNAITNYAELVGQKANLYKCFIPLAWRLACSAGISALLHPDGIYDESNGGRFRELTYAKLRAHFQFRNERRLFPITNKRKFSINIYGSDIRDINFFHISNLFTPITIDRCFASRSSIVDTVGAIKDANNNWNETGHPDRLTRIGACELSVFADLFHGGECSPSQSSLPAVHAIQQLAVLEKLSRQSVKLVDFIDEFDSTQHWNEKNAQDEKLIEKRTAFALTNNDVILSGSHIYCGNPFYKSAQEVCNHAKNFDPLDIREISSGFLPRTNFQRMCDADRLYIEDPELKWGGKFVDQYRIAYRSMLDAGMERTLNCAIIPPGFTHINSIRSYSFKDHLDLLVVSGMHTSLVFDFLVKSTGKQNLHKLLNEMPSLDLGNRNINLFKLAELSAELNCVSPLYVPLLEEFASRTGIHVRPSVTPFSRRNTHIEIDVIVAYLVGLDVNELCAVYKNEFWVLYQNECDTWYDTQGSIVFTPSAGLIGVGLAPKASSKIPPITIKFPDGTTDLRSLGWDDAQKFPSGTRLEYVKLDDTLQGGPHERTIEYVAPFFCPDREEDYRVAWKSIEARAKEADA